MQRAMCAAGLGAGLGLGLWFSLRTREEATQCVSTPEPAVHTGTASCGGLSATCSVTDRGPKGSIITGICFLDHMLDQLQAHGQFGLSVQVSLHEVAFKLHEDYCGASLVNTDPSEQHRPHDETIFRIVGQAVGQALYGIMQAAPATSVRFCCPLDESLSEVMIDSHKPGALLFDLAPYGTHSQGGRKWIGKYRTSLTQSLWEGFAAGLRCELSVRKVRGDNAHHIIEASFKAFARALRQWLEAGTPVPVAVVRNRAATRARKTNETQIQVQLALDSDAGCSISTGVQTLDLMLREFGELSGFSLTVKAKGDLFICEHHTVEDVGIAVGQVLCEALGDRRGCVRMATQQHQSGGSSMEAVLDLSNRPAMFSDLRLDSEFVEDMSAEMVAHFFESLASAARVTLHLVKLPQSAGTSSTDAIKAAAGAVGKAFKLCSCVDSRLCGRVASSKGTLSV